MRCRLDDLAEEFPRVVARSVRGSTSTSCLGSRHEGVLQDREMSWVELGCVEDLQFRLVHKHDQDRIADEVERVDLCILLVVEAIKLDGLALLIDVEQLDQIVPSER